MHETCGSRFEFGRSVAFLDLVWDALVATRHILNKNTMSSREAVLIPLTLTQFVKHYIVANGTFVANG